MVKLISTYHVAMASNLPPLSPSPSSVLTECYCLNAQRAARRLARLYDDAFRPLGLSHGQFSLLMLVAGMEPASVGQVAQQLVMDRTTVTAIVKPMERRGLLEATASPTDLRQRLLSVTREGRALLARALPVWQGAQELVREQRPPAAVRGHLQQLAATAARPLSRPR
jgi:DNA-binding MarR family transcriptional regulator